MKRKDWLYLSGLTLAALLVSGYHPYVEDAEFYLPGVKKLLNPALFPFGADFFQAHASMTLFPSAIAWSVRVSHLPLEVMLLLLHSLCVFLLLLACWKVGCACFESPEARWGAVALVAALLTIPVAGTRLYILDQYLNPRSISCFAVVFAVALAIERKPLGAMLWLTCAGLAHPLMPVYGLVFIFLLAWTHGLRAAAAALWVALPLGISLAPPSAAYHQAALRHPFHYVIKWAWYEWLGVFAPIILFVWFSRIAREHRMPKVDLVCRSLVPFVLLSLAGALLLDIPARFEALARLQPMRGLHLVYILMFMVMGGFLGQFVLKRNAARWLLLFLPLCAGMTYVQLQVFPASAHLEWPGRSSRNEWVQAFEWIRSNTPNDAYFALDPHHMELPGEDEHAFRAIAERSMLADAVKDSGAVSMFPALAEEWWEQLNAQDGWKKFDRGDFQKLKAQYGVNWIVLEQPAVKDLRCPFQNSRLLVCRVD